MTFHEMAKELAQLGYCVDRAKGVVIPPELSEDEEGVLCDGCATNATAI